MTRHNPRHPPVSRRSRPAKAPLSRALIVSTALDLLERDGIPGLSLRRVAAALDTGAASLYVYLENLDDLHAQMLDQALAAVPSAGGNGPWRDRLKYLLLTYLRTLYERQGLAQLALSTVACGPNSLRIWDSLLGLLREGGVDDGKAAWGVDLLTLYVTGIAAEQSTRLATGHGLERVRDALAGVSATEFPLVYAFREALISGDGEARAAWALDVMIDGIVGSRDPRTP